LFDHTVRSSRTRTARLALMLVVGALLVVACGDDDDEVAEPTTTTTTSTTTTTTTTTEVPAVAPLTGLEVDDESLVERPVVAVKIASDRNAQPQEGLATAEVVFEELVEFGISRFLAIFHTTDSDPAGPMRSARTSEIDLLPVFGRPIFAHSGGNPGTLIALRNANVGVDAGADSAYGHLQWRDTSRARPNNLFTATDAVRIAAGEDASPPTAWFRFLDDDEDPPHHAVPAIGIDVSFGSTNTRWVWDEERREFLRWQDGREHLDPDDRQLGFDTVVVMATPYGVSPGDSRSPEANTVGSGEAWVLSNGWLASGTWDRPAPDQPWVIRDGDGEEIPLAPGRIWVALPRAGVANVHLLDADPRTG
jgi:hypothetical protein